MTNNTIENVTVSTMQEDYAFGYVSSTGENIFISNHLVNYSNMEPGTKFWAKVCADDHRDNRRAYALAEDIVSDGSSLPSIAEEPHPVEEEVDPVEEEVDPVEEEVDPVEEEEPECIDEAEIQIFRFAAERMVKARSRSVRASEYLDEALTAVNTVLKDRGLPLVRTK